MTVENMNGGYFSCTTEMKIEITFINRSNETFELFRWENKFEQISIISRMSEWM